MNERGPIVCGTDLSPASETSVDLAAQLARALGRPLHLVCVTATFDDSGEPTNEAERVFRERLAERRDAARDGLGRAAERAGKTASDVEAHLVGGRPYEALLAHADRADASMIAVGAHGHAGAVRTTRENLGEWLLGSTADRLVRHSHVPVLVGGRDEGLHKPLCGTKWLVALDGSGQARAALRIAHAMADRCDATLELVHALEGPYALTDPVGPTDPFPPVHPAERARVENELRGLAKAALGEDLPLTLHAGEPSHVLVSAAAERDASLIVMGTHGRAGLRHFLLGSVAERTLRRSPIPVLCVPR
ncbi:MAG: universal stress protein [Sandaracinaceae bacterium]